MNILIFTEDFYPNIDGGALVQWRFARLAVQQGHNVTVLTSTHPTEPAEKTVEGVQIIRPGSARGGDLQGYEYTALFFRMSFSINVFLRGRELLQPEDFDCIYSPTQSTQWAASALSKLYNLPHISFVGGTPSIKHSTSWTPKRLLERLNFEMFMGQTVFCRNEIVRDILESKGHSVEISYGILDAENVCKAHRSSNARREQYAQPGEILLVYVGRLVPLKNPEAALEILKTLPDHYRLIMVGDGPLLDTLRNKARTDGISDRVTLTGQLPHSEALETIASADGLLLTSNFEAHPTVAFEGLSLGCEVFATSVGTLPSFEFPSLHIAEIDDIPERIRTCEPESSVLNRELLESFSVETYASDVLAAMDRLTEKSA